MDDDQITKEIEEKIREATAFSTIKYGDTPVDANQLVPKKYVDTQISSVVTVIASVLTIAEDRYILYRTLSPTATNVVQSVVGGDLVVPFTGSILTVGATVDTAGVTSVAQYNIRNNNTSILSVNIHIDSTEKTSRTASISAVVAFPNFTTGDTLTFDVIGVQSVAAKGLTFFMNVKKTG